MAQPPTATKFAAIAEFVASFPDDFDEDERADVAGEIERVAETLDLVDEYDVDLLTDDAASFERAGEILGVDVSWIVEHHQERVREIEEHNEKRDGDQDDDGSGRWASSSGEMSPGDLDDMFGLLRGEK